MVGGTAAHVTGDKFANGAVTAAFAYVARTIGEERASEASGYQEHADASDAAYGAGGDLSFSDHGIFSITYGPDEAGHVTMNFGPLNRTGGERRLNVAMTRAVADLKHFLEYAERGASALGAAVHGSMGDFESPFEVAVARGLQEKGWIVHPQIGVSAYRIDMGIVHPDKPGIYLAGIECDGAMYHSSAYARERDKVRQGVLEGLGWTLFRVWSTD